MNCRELLRAKTVSVEEAVERIPGDSYLFTYGFCEPYTLLTHLEPLLGTRKNITFMDSLHLFPYAFYSDERYRGVVETQSIFFSHFCSAYQKAGRASFVPNHLGRGMEDKLIFNRRNGRPFMVYAIQVSPMDRHGYFTVGPCGMSNRMLVENADRIIVEINENMPRTFGNTYIHVSEIDCAFYGENKLFYLPEKPITPEDEQIGRYIADLVEDESTVQLGIGGIPSAAAIALREKKDLGIHTEMLGDSIVDLVECGAVTNRKKTLYPDKIVTAFSAGTQKTYDFIHDNSNVLHLEVKHVNDPHTIAKNRKMVSVNTTLQVDLMGQCASEAIGTVQISGTGGQTETASGAKLSPGGKSIIALKSTAMVKNSEGVRERKSTIVSVHPAGTVISLLRADVDYVVTEYGVAALRGAPLSSRAEQLIAIAHPDFREELRAEARRFYLL